MALIIIIEGNLQNIASSGAFLKGCVISSSKLPWSIKITVKNIFLDSDQILKGMGRDRCLCDGNYIIGWKTTILEKKVFFNQ